MKSVAVIAIVLSVFIIQAAVAQDWKEIVAKENNDRFVQFAQNMRKFIIAYGDDPVCIENAITKIDSLLDPVKRKIDNCVNSTSDRDLAEQCAKNVVTTGILTVASIKCKSETL